MGRIPLTADRALMRAKGRHKKTEKMKRTYGWLNEMHEVPCITSEQDGMRDTSTQYTQYPQVSGLSQ